MPNPGQINISLALSDAEPDMETLKDKWPVLGEKLSVSIISVDVVKSYCAYNLASPLAIAEAIMLSGSPMMSVPMVGRKGLWDLLPTGLFPGIQGAFVDVALTSMEEPRTK